MILFSSIVKRAFPVIFYPKLRRLPPHKTYFERKNPQRRGKGNKGTIRRIDGQPVWSLFENYWLSILATVSFRVFHSCVLQRSHSQLCAEQIFRQYIATTSLITCRPKQRKSRDI